MMQDIQEYLVTKVRGPDLNPKPKRSVQLLRMIDNEGHEMLDWLMEDYLTYARKVIQRSFKRSKVEGEAPITQAAMTIGKYIIEGTWSDMTLIQDHVRVGDLIIEGFVMCGYLTITAGNIRSAKPVTIHATEKWGEHESEAGDTPCITAEPIPQITSIIQNNGRSVIKGWDRSKEHIFLRHKDGAWVKAIDKLQAVKWKVNTQVHEAIMANWDSFVKHDRFTGPDKAMNQKLMQRQASKNREYKEIMATARKWIGEDFHFYLDADYRGRLYYGEPYFNFQGSDMARGQLLFANGKLFDESASFWLAVHTACSYNQSYHKDELPEWITADYKEVLEEEGLENISVDKMTLEDRATWTQQNIEFVIQTAMDKTIYKDAEKPISFLACAFEWLAFSESDGEYYTHLPIPIDGSNNGWQHLGAMSKDTRTGSLVGLIPVEIQNDFYVQVAKKLIDRMPEWFEERQMPMKKIRKGISKRAAMTRAYSCGANKMAESMYSDCYQEGYTQDFDIKEADCMVLSNNIIKAIEDVCPGPLRTMKYLQKLADQEITNWMTKYGTDRGRGIEWTTPSGFPVIYEAYRKKQIKVNNYGFNTPQGEIQFKHNLREKTDIPDRRGFMCGISPNFVHSMDASHMALVIAEWEGDFGAVHDSFSAHAGDIEFLMDSTRKAFVELYDKENFYETIPFGEGYEGKQPKIGTLEISGVLDSDFFFC